MPWKSGDIAVVIRGYHCVLYLTIIEKKSAMR
jgi:hypothetical protein